VELTDREKKVLAEVEARVRATDRGLHRALTVGSFARRRDGMAPFLAGLMGILLILLAGVVSLPVFAIVGWWALLTGALLDVGRLERRHSAPRPGP
jgi:hypothetical protein